MENLNLLNEQRKEPCTIRNGTGVVLALFLGLLFGAAPMAVATISDDLELFGATLPSITTPELHAALGAGMPLLVIDARPPQFYLKAHVPGSINVTVDGIEKQGPALPKDKIIVVYCGGPSCPHSLLVAKWLIAHNRPLVRWYAEGFPGWAQAGYQTERGS